jgi:IS30 family transposase
MKSYTHITTLERKEIEYLREQKYSLRKIADILKRDVSSISREIRRNSMQKGYDA